MTLDMLGIAVLGVAALLYAAFVPGKGRGWALLIGSVVGIYWLQPALPIRFGSYILQTVTIVLTVMSWLLTRPQVVVEQNDTGQEKRPFWHEDRVALLLIGGLIVVLAFNRFLASEIRITAGRPPSPLAAALALLFVAVLFAGLLRLLQRLNQRTVLSGAIVVIVVLFVIMKTAPLATMVSTLWRTLTNQDLVLAGIVDLNWLGFSYVAFRLIHTMRDRQTGQLPPLSLREYVTYVIFTPAYIAGPIDRAERFVKDFRALLDMVGLEAARFTDAGSRIVAGMFKKFVLADMLAQGVSLNPISATQVTSTGGLWLLLYGYAFRLFFDFSGYTDIAIGLGLLFGIRLPENFKRPYLQTNITQFWQSWHITLSNWVRFYVFSPLSRSLLRRKPRPSPTLIVFVSQMTTMIVIGLWHGMSWNFFIWGIWHGVALFVHKMWSDRTRKWYRGLKEKPRQKQAWTLFSWFITFQYVVIGWIWFVIPDVDLAFETIGKLFGFGW